MLLRDYFNPSNLYKNCELLRNQIGRRVIRIKKENEKFTVVCSRSPQILEFGHFTLLFCTGRHRNVPKLKTHVQGDCFPSLNLLFCGVVVVATHLAILYADRRDRRKSPGVPGGAIAIFAGRRNRRIKSSISGVSDIGD